MRRRDGEGILQARPNTRGERHYSARASDDEVRSAVAAYYQGEKQKDIADRLGVDRSTVAGWVNGYNRTWGK